MEKQKISIATKWLSNRKYLNEVSVEGKYSNRYYKLLGLFDSYHAQILRIGNCLTLLSTPITVTIDRFWNLHYLEDYSRFVFLTFNRSFLYQLKQRIRFLKKDNISLAIQLLGEHPEAFNDNLHTEGDEELQWCLVKKGKLKSDPKFGKMFLADQRNRQELLEALTAALHSNDTLQPEELKQLASEDPISFLDVLQVKEGDNAVSMLNYIKELLSKAEFEYDIFIKIEKGEGGRNPYGLNPRIGAMVDFVMEKNFTQPQFTRQQIFQAYMVFTGNTIGKFNIFLSEYRKSDKYRHFYNALKALSINKLKQQVPVIT